MLEHVKQAFKDKGKDRDATVEEEGRLQRPEAAD